MKQFNVAENTLSSGSTLATHTFSLASSAQTTLTTLSSGQFTVKVPTVAVKYNTSADGRNGIGDYIYVSCAIGNGAYVGQAFLRTDWGGSVLSANTNMTMINSYSSDILGYFNIEDYFNSNNPTVRTLPLNWKITSDANQISTGIISNYGMAIVGYKSDAVNVTVASEGSITLDAPPTYDISSLSINTTYIYAGLTTASVSVSNLSAKYGGTISEVKFTIDNQSVTRTDAGTLSILPENAGTFTPTVTVTDSRGQKTVQTLDPITVQEYQLPTASISNIYRINAQGKDDEEGTYIRASVTFDYDDNWVKLTTPTVRLLNSSGQAVSGWSLVRWYRSRTAEPPNQWIGVNWSTVTKNQTVGVCIQLPSNSSVGYTIEITPKATTGTETHTGSPVTALIPPAFFTIDFLAGGKGIAFGGPVSQEGFWNYMNTYFMKDIFMNLDSAQASGTDHDLLTAISNLGWTSDVTSST